jgi:hypothetical protein
LQATPQCPLTQVGAPLSGLLQAAPQALQFDGSSSTRMHAPLQGANPLLHAMPQALFVQTAVPLLGTGHERPQAPQLDALVDVFTQADEHSDVPEGHVLTQVPSAHASLAVHVFPHPPQLDGSVAVETQELPHFTNPKSHANPQVPLVQVGAPNAGELQA